MALLLGTRRALLGRRTPTDYRTRWGLVSMWELEEASGARADAHGTNTLTDNNTVTQATGKVGSAAQFTSANSEYLSITDNASISTGDIDWWVAAWVYPDSLTGDPTIASRWNASTGNREYWLGYLSTSGRYALQVSPDGTSSGNTTVSANNRGAASTGAWDFVMAWHDSVNNTINIRVNHGTPDPAAHSTGVFDSAATFRLGALISGAGSLTEFWNGRMDQAAFGKSPALGIAALADEISSVLYGGGNGVTYAGISGG